MQQAFQTFVGAVFSGLVTAVFAISFAAIIYAGDLSAFLDRGIALTLVGCIVLAIVGIFTLSFRGSILSAQDVPALILASAAATSIGTFGLTGEEAFASTAALVATASVATGLAGVLVGRLKLAYLARFVPYPVLAGFLSATGLLLVIGGLNIAIEARDSSIGIAGLFDPSLLQNWMLPFVAAVLILVCTRFFKSRFLLPLSLIATALVHYGMFWAMDMTLEEARASGFLLGPFDQDGFFSKIDLSTATHANWYAVFAQAPVILTIVVSCLIGATLNASGLELAFGKDFDVNREISGVGLANFLGGLVGSIPGYHSLSDTVLANKLGLNGAWVGLSGAAGCAAVLLFGAGVLSLLPVGLFAAVILFLGFDLLYTWLFEERRRLNSFDYSIVLLMTIVAVTYSFMTAIAIGLLTSSIFFIFSYAKLNLIRSHSNLTTRRSLIERPDHELLVLDECGHRAQIVELSGFLFFATAYSLREKIKSLLSGSDRNVDWLVLDFTHVSGIDVSTLRILQRIGGDLSAKGTKLILTCIEEQLGAHAPEFHDNPNTVCCETLNEALEDLEETLLAETYAEVAVTAETDISYIETLIEENQISDFIETIELADGETLVEAGGLSQHIYLVRSGSLRILVQKEGEAPKLVARIRDRGLVGEMAYYSEGRRSASIISEGSCNLVQIDMNFMKRFEEARPGAAFQFHKLAARNLARRLQRTTRLLHELGGLKP
ncbi:MAG: SulP family inorganic anion transporter [Pseudoruegeria sp.]